MNLINQFAAISDSGQTYTLCVYQDLVDVSTFDDPNAKIPGSKQILTEGGMPVNWIDKNNFRLAETGEFIRRIM